MLVNIFNGFVFIDIIVKNPIILRTSFSFRCSYEYQELIYYSISVFEPYLLNEN